MPSSLLSANACLITSNLSLRIHGSEPIPRKSQNLTLVPREFPIFLIPDGRYVSSYRIKLSRFTKLCSKYGENPVEVEPTMNSVSEIANEDDEVDSKLRIEEGTANVPLYLRWSKMSLSDRAFFLLAFMACMTSVAFTALIIAAVPALYAIGRAATSLSKLADTAREELPSTMAAVRLSGMEISDLTLELSDLSQDIAAGVNKSTRAVQAAEAGIRQIFSHAREQTVSMIQERASLPPISFQPVVAGAARKTSRAITRAKRTLMNIISGSDFDSENQEDDS